MERREDIKVKPGFEYDHFFPKAKLISITKKKGATVADTLLLIPAVVRETLFHTKKFAKEVVQDDSVEQTCKNLWQFVYDYIAYKKDEDGKEQVRSPARTWHDRHNTDENGEPMGVDCDCMTVFIVSCLCNLGIENIFFRIAKYPDEDKTASQINWSHIYPVVILPNGKQITIDCVVRKFNYEEPYLQKQDKIMDLEYLNGVTVSDRGIQNSDSQDLIGLMGEREALAELGRVFNGSSLGARKKGKFKELIKKGFHYTNVLNPAAVTIRAGILAAMKLNFLKIGGNIRYAYLSDDQAKKMGLLMDRFHKMKKVLATLEKIFYAAGGKPENLKKAILTGHGNRHREVPVNGLGYIPYENIDGLNEDAPLSQVLGRDIYSSESVDGLGELGEPATAATITAATTVLTTIVALIKKVGNLMPKKPAGGDDGSSGGGGNPGGDDSNSSSNSTTANDNSDTGNNNQVKTTIPKVTNSSGGSGGGGGDNTTDTSTNNTPATTNDSNPATTNDTGNNTETGDDARKVSGDALKDTTKDTPKKPSFWDKNKKWIKPTGIAAGSLGLLALLYKLLKPKPKADQAPPPKLLPPGVNGTPRKNKRKKNFLNGVASQKKKGGHKSKGKKKPIALL